MPAQPTVAYPGGTPIASWILAPWHRKMSDKGQIHGSLLNIKRCCAFLLTGLTQAMTLSVCGSPVQEEDHACPAEARSGIAMRTAVASIDRG